MSAPSRTYFCKNGHVVIHFDHGDWFEEDECPKNCSICDSTEIRSIVEWGDPDYPSSEDVPTNPINYEQRILVNIPRKTIKETFLPVYDVSKLFEKGRVKQK